MGVMPEQCLLNVRYMQRQCIVPIKRLSVLLAAYCCIIRRNLYVILRETGEGEEKTLVGIDDEKTLDDVFKKYQKHSTDEN